MTKITDGQTALIEMIDYAAGERPDYPLEVKAKQLAEWLTELRDLRVFHEIDTTSSQDKP